MRRSLSREAEDREGQHHSRPVVVAPMLVAGVVATIVDVVGVSTAFRFRNVDARCISTSCDTSPDCHAVTTASANLLVYAWEVFSKCVPLIDPCSSITMRRLCTPPGHRHVLFIQQIQVPVATSLTGLRKRLPNGSCEKQQVSVTVVVTFNTSKTSSRGGYLNNIDPAGFSMQTSTPRLLAKLMKNAPMSAMRLP